MNLEDAKEMLDLYVQAEIAVLKGQEFRSGDDVWRRADLPAIRAGRREFEKKVQALDGTSARGRGPSLVRFG